MDEVKVERRTSLTQISEADSSILMSEATLPKMSKPI